MDAALAVTILQAIATTIIGAIALYFARMQALTGRTQALTNQNEFRLRFFDRRFAVYDAVMEFSRCIAGKGSITQEQLREYVKKMREASFFFDDEIQAYCNEVAKNGVDLMIAHNVMEAPDSPSYNDMVKMYGELMVWFVEQVDKAAKPRFERFLRIRE